MTCSQTLLRIWGQPLLVNSLEGRGPSGRLLMRWLKEWAEADRAVEMVFGPYSRTWALRMQSLRYAVVVAFMLPWRIRTGRWRCALCGAPLPAALEHHRCPHDDVNVRDGGERPLQLNK